MTTRIIIVDDHGLIRAGLRALLNQQPDLDIVGEAEDGSTALQLTAEHQPDIVLMDISMRGMNGIEATRQIAKIAPQTRVIALTVHEDESMMREMIRAGAYGYLIKKAAEAELIQAIQVVLQGLLYIHPAMTRSLVKDLSPHASARSEPQETLTRREQKVLVLLARGYTNRQIAQELNISQRTVEGHRSNLIGKLGISSRVELMNYVEEHHLVFPERHENDV